VKDTKVGDVIMVTHAVQGRADETNLLDAPAWAVTDRVGGGEVHPIWIVGDNDRLRRLCPYLVNTLDEWTVPSPDKWPDEVCEFMAKRALLGDLTNG
jgi:hypothetical protein